MKREPSLICASISVKRYLNAKSGYQYPLKSLCLVEYIRGAPDIVSGRIIQPDSRVMGLSGIRPDTR